MFCLLNYFFEKKIISFVFILDLTIGVFTIFFIIFFKKNKNSDDHFFLKKFSYKINFKFIFFHFFYYHHYHIPIPPSSLSIMAPKKDTTEFIPEIKLIPITLKNGDIIYESHPSIFENYWQNGITEAYEHDNYTMMSDVPENAETRNETQMKYTFDSLKDIPRQTNQIFKDIYIPIDKNKFDKRSLNFHVLYDCIPFKKSLREILLSGSYKQVLQALLRMPFVAYIYINDDNFKPFHEDDKYTYSDKFWYAFCLYNDEKEEDKKGEEEDKKGEEEDKKGEEEEDKKGEDSTGS